MKDAKMKQLMDLAEQLDKYVSNFPYQVNVLSETHTFNYMHTGILARFLQYPPLLESFLSSLPDWDMEIGEPEISLPHNNYDILVLMPGKYAVVIVNNVYGSELEYEKIVTSFKKDINGVVAPDNIWIFIINKNDDAKSSIDGRTDFHYEFWTYKQEYLSWLRGLRIDNEEVLLRSAIDQYINFLENDLGIVDQREKLQMADFVMQALGYIPYETTSQTYQLLQEANRLLSVIPIAQKILMDSVKRSFVRLSSKILTETFPNRNILQEDGTEKKYYRQRMEAWPTYIYLQWEPFTWDSLLKISKLKLSLHINQDKKDIWEVLLKNGYNVLFENECYEHIEYLDTAFCDMNENTRDEILLRCYKPFIPVLNVVYEYLHNDK
jgi:hypothetical protein